MNPPSSSIPTQPPHYRILVVDDNPSIHSDFRKILCPGNAGDTTLRTMEAALFDEVQAAAPTVHFQLDSAYQGQEGLAMVQRSSNRLTTRRLIAASNSEAML